MRHLRRAMQRDAAADGVVGGMRRARFHRCGVLAMRADVELDGLGRTIPHGVEARRFDFALEDDVAGRFGVDLRRTVLECVAGLDEGLRGIDFNLDQVGDVLGFFLARRDDRGNGFADVTDDFIGKDRLADGAIRKFMQHRRDHLHALKIGGGDHHFAAGIADLDDLAGGFRAPHKAHPMCGGQVGGEATLAAHQRRIFKPADGAADPFQSGAFGFRRAHVCECSSARRTTARTKSRRYSPVV